MKTEESQTFSYQTRIALDDKELRALDDYALIFSSVTHKLFAEISAGNASSALKNDYLKSFGITARQFNACRVSVEGKIASIKELRSGIIANLKGRIDSLGKRIQRLAKHKEKKHELHQKKRRFSHLSHRLDCIKEDHKTGRIRLCFGGRKLFRAQFDLESNAYESHEEWKEDWKNNRCNEIFVLGSKDETTGNQSCTARLEEDGALTLHLRLPNALVAKYGKYLEISHVRFQYGHDAIIASLQECLERREKKEGYQNFGQAISYRFKRDKKGWRLFASTALKKPVEVTREGFGVIGVDINIDHLALAETDRFGNVIAHKTIPLLTYGQDKNQTQANIGTASAEVVRYAREVKKPLIVEKLDFQKKKAALSEMDKSRARQLSSFAYNATLQFLKSRAWRFGVSIKGVNPAFTSLIGRVKFAKRYGLSIHHAAALCIARRYLGFSEQPPSDSTVSVPDGRGAHVALPLPVRNRGKHVWSFWRKLYRKIPAVLVAHFRAMRHRSLDPPMPILVTE